jgi:hypothetical protein
MSQPWLFAGLGLSLALACVDIFAPSWPGTPSHLALADAAAQAPADQDQGDAVVRSVSVCIAAPRWSAGELGRTILYRVRRDDDRMQVGYFVYWSTERPWGRNRSSFALVPALLTDAVYSHFLFVLPGLQRLLYGPGDVEGVRVTFARTSTGWVPISAIADDDYHREVELQPDEFVDAEGRIVLMTDVWSHQLGAHHAVRSVALGGSAMTCFAGDTMRPLTEETACAFRLGSPAAPLRAPPAWRLWP